MVNFIICGLGNPEPENATTRHNVGFMFVDWLLAQAAAGDSALTLVSQVERGDASLSLMSFTATGFLPVSLALICPKTGMNSSGEPLARFVAEQKGDSLAGIPLQNIVLAYDDIDLEPAAARFRLSGSDGGHRGVRSIIEQLGSDGLPRVKLGVGRPPKDSGIGVLEWVRDKGLPEADLAKLRAVAFPAAFRSFKEHAARLSVKVSAG